MVTEEYGMSNQTTYSLAQYVRAHRRRIVLGIALVCGSVLISVFTPFITRFAIDDLVDGGVRWSAVLLYACAYLVAALCSASFALWMRKVLLSLGHQIEYEIRRDVFDHLTRLDYYFYSRERTGDLMTKMTSDLNSVREFVGQGILQGARTSIGFVLAFGVMFAINVRMALVMLFLLPSTSLLFFLLLRIIRKRYEETQEQFSVISNYSQESFAGIRTIRGYGIEDRQNAYFAKLNEHYIDLKMALSRVERPLWPAMSMLFSLGVALILWIGGRQVVAGELSVGEFVQFTQYLFILQWPMLALGWTINLLQRGLTSWKRIQSILNAEPLIRDESDVSTKPEIVRGDIMFDNVHLELGGIRALDGINLTVRQGETLAITGPTGSGKTVLAWLVARLIEPTGGRVLIGGRDVRTIPLEALRRYVGIAPQEAFLFSDTLANNIAFGLEETDLEKVFTAAEVAELKPDVETFPDRYETLLGERGVTLSGGQRQRTAISRAIARNPEILILDDVFSAIDTQTEANIQARLRPVMSERTTLLISHRVSGLRHADRIIVLQNGRITQEGTHRELVEQPGYYRELDEVQRLQARLETST